MLEFAIFILEQIYAGTWLTSGDKEDSRIFDAHDYEVVLYMTNLCFTYPWDIIEFIAVKGVLLSIAYWKKMSQCVHKLLTLKQTEFKGKGIRSIEIRWSLIGNIQISSMKTCTWTVFV